MTASTYPVSRPSMALLGTEPWRAAYEYAAHKLARKPRLAQQGDGHPVIIFPGLGTDGTAVAPLRDYCRSLGYDAMDWGCGFNTGPQGDVDAWLKQLAAHVESLLVHNDKPATLIGWSLGGFYARELGKLLGPRVRQVITIGTPFNAETDHTNVGWVFRLLNGKKPGMTAALSRRLKKPPSVPTTSIYSRSDGIVAWQTCCHDACDKGDAATPHVEDIEIRSSHIGMGWNPAVLTVVADRLAQKPGNWHPYGVTA